MRVSALTVRWFRMAGLAQDEACERACAAAARTKRYPFPMSWVYALTVCFIEWSLPLILLGRFSRASRLSDPDFDKFVHKVHNFPVFLIRVLFIFVRLPLWEQLCPDDKPEAQYKHPLIGKLSKPRSESEYDVIVIGSGAGGAPVAWQLSRAGAKVAIIESGSLVEPQSTAYVLEHYYTQQTMTISTKGGMLPIMSGNTVGGTTSINSGTTLRPPQERLEEWDQKVGSNFATGVLEPYFDRVDKILGTNVPPKSLLGPSADLFEKGLEVLGRSDTYVLPRNAPNCQGSGRCCFVCPVGAKTSTDMTYLPEAIEHGCTLFAETRATKVRESAEGVVVSVEHGGKSYRIKGRKLVLSAGAIGTPRLIRRGHLGSQWRQAGRHLHIHPAAKVFAYFKEAVHGEKGVPQGLGYHPPELPRVTCEGVFTPKATASPVISEAGEMHHWWLQHYEHVASFGLMVRERGEGRIRYIGPWPIMRYKLTREDLHDLVSGLLLCAEAFLAAGAEKILLPVSRMPSEWSSLEELRQLDPKDFKQSNLIASGFHPQGTAAMGHVVDKDLSLIGSRNIYVCDASVMPASPGVNPQVTIMGLSLRLADRIGKDLHLNIRNPAISK